MYSQYLDYHDAAVKANHLAQAQNEQKDIIIGHLRNDLYELRQIESEYYKLNELILALEEKYSLLLDEKDRTQKEQRIKSDIDKNTILDLKDEIELLRMNIQKASLRIQDLLRENTLKKRMNDARIGDVQGLSLEIKGIDNKNQRCIEENRSLAITVKGLKDQRKRLEEACDGMSALLDDNMAKLKNLEKLVRNNESVNARLDKTLHMAENDNQKLITELKLKNQEAKRAQNKLRSLTNSINEMKLTYNNVLSQSQKNKAESGANAANLNNEIAKGKQLSAKIASTEASIRSQQNQLDIIIKEEEKQRKNHFLGVDDNKQLNGELDRLLALISEFQLINKELIDQIEIYGDQDQQAISILNRREQMRQLISGTIRKVTLTAQHIKHIKY